MAAGVGEHDQRVNTGQGGGIAQFGLAGFLPCRRVPDLARELTAAGRIACLDGSDSNGEGSGAKGLYALAGAGWPNWVAMDGFYPNRISSTTCLLASFASDEYPGPTQHYCV